MLCRLARFQRPRPFQHRTIMKVVPVPVRKDNYAYLLIDESSKTAATVDPYDIAKVTAVAKEHGVNIVAAITTHHHHDHAGGNKVRHSIRYMTRMGLTYFIPCAILHRNL